VFGTGVVGFVVREERRFLVNEAAGLARHAIFLDALAFTAVLVWTGKAHNHLSCLLV
jgi:hypothetical protein